MIRRIVRHLFTIASALSLLLCVAVCVLWVRSYDRQLDWARASEGYPHWPVMSEGLLQIGYVGPRRPLDRLPQGRFLFFVSWNGMYDVRELGPRQWTWKQLCFGEQTGAFFIWDSESLVRRKGLFAEFRICFIPLWSIVLALSVFPIFWLRSFIIQHRANAIRRRGVCPFCGYDLRVQKSGERCPECGTVVS